MAKTSDTQAGLCACASRVVDVKCLTPSKLVKGRSSFELCADPIRAAAPPFTTGRRAICVGSRIMFSRPTCVGAGRLLVKNRRSVSVEGIDARYAVVDESQLRMSHCRSFCERFKHWHGHGPQNKYVNPDEQSPKLIQTGVCSYRELESIIFECNMLYFGQQYSTQMLMYWLLTHVEIHAISRYVVVVRHHISLLQVAFLVIKRISLIAFHSAATGSFVCTHPMHLFSNLMKTVELMRPSMQVKGKKTETRTLNTIPRHSHEDEQSNLRCDSEEKAADVEQRAHTSADTAVL
jgi:hypothetical protein